MSVFNLSVRIVFALFVSAFFAMPTFAQVAELQKKADSGDVKAQLELGFHYDTNNNYEDAMEWYRKAADNGSAAANVGIGFLILNGQGVPQNKEKGEEIIRKSVDGLLNDAKQDEPIAQVIMGWCYSSGKGVTEDKAEAVKWYRKAAEQGDARAQSILGNCYYAGKGVTEDKAEAVKWYRKAAEQGYANAQDNLGDCYYSGIGFDGYKDYKEAMKWYRKAAEQGNRYSQISLGNCYYEGRGVEKNIEEARKWFKKGGEPKDSIADYKAGMRFLELKEFKDAVKALKLAADKGHGDAHYQLYKIYDDCGDHKDGLAAQELDKNSDGKEDESGKKFYGLKKTHIMEAAAVNHPAGLCFWAVYSGKSDSECRELYIRGQELGCSFTLPVLEENLNIPASDPKEEAARQERKAAKAAAEKAAWEANACTACNDNGKIYGCVGKSFFLQNPKYDSRTCPVCDGTKQKKRGRRLCGGCDGGGYTTSTSNYVETEYQGNGRSISYDRSSTSASKCGVCKGDGYLSN